MRGQAGEGERFQHGVELAAEQLVGEFPARFIREKKALVRFSSGVFLNDGLYLGRQGDNTVFARRL